MWESVLLNLLYSVVGGAMTLAFMVLGYKILDALTPYTTAELLAQGNTAIGVSVAGMFIGIGCAIGLVIGLALN